MTGGVQGLQLDRVRAPFGLPLTSNQWMFLVALAIAVVMFRIARNLLDSRTGRAMMAIRDHHMAADTMGVNTAHYKTMTFGVSALYTGVAGALFAIILEFASPDNFRFELSIAILVGAVVGGIASLPGAVIGGVFVQVIEKYADAAARELSSGPAPADRDRAVDHLRHRADRARLLHADGHCGRARHGVGSGEAAMAGPGQRQVVESAFKLQLGGDIHMLHLSRSLLTAGAAALALALTATTGSAQKKYDEGASDTEIRIGNTNPYSGPASAYGTIGKVIEAYFKKVNDEGGIKGRKINFITYDDGYSPPKTREMVTKLVEADKVLFVFQTLGTPSNTAIQKYLNEAKVPQLFVATGASKWGHLQGQPLDDGLPARLRHRSPSSTPSTSWPT